MTGSTIATAPRRPIRSIFIGKDGLRAGWSLLLYLLAFAILMMIATALVHPKAGPAGAPQPLRATLIAEAAFSIAALGAAYLLAPIERRRFAAYGLQRAHALRDALRGMAWGLALLSLLVGTMVVSGALVVDRIALSPAEALGYGAGWLVTFCLVGLFEEFLTRGFLQYTLARGIAGLVGAVVPRARHARTIGFWVAATILSVGLFAAGHIGNAGETVLGLISVALAGLTFAYALYRTGSLWWAIGFHAMWDWAQSFLYGVPDSGLMMEGHLLATHPAGATLLSGGATGPEGSVLIIPTLLLALVVIHRTLPRRATAFDA
ncbi:type II CAAX endopeptidase family protein [Sphingomonas sp. RB3P16]|uniref:CPBP family intramembrane glutamic endopeptidase n=1 Tax=Parasphingomonas frigoris TaxID=3096163 RepID=UPI002FCC417D